MTGPWQVFFGADHKRHVEPKGDLRPHRHSVNCWCKPTADLEDQDVLIHNSMDERERFERRGALQ